jgi:hypothetical protein
MSWVLYGIEIETQELLWLQELYVIWVNPRHYLKAMQILLHFKPYIV